MRKRKRKKKKSAGRLKASNATIPILGQCGQVLAPFVMFSGKGERRCVGYCVLAHIHPFAGAARAGSRQQAASRQTQLPTNRIGYPRPNFMASNLGPPPRDVPSSSKRTKGNLEM